MLSFFTVEVLVLVPTTVEVLVLSPVTVESLTESPPTVLVLVESWTMWVMFSLSPMVDSL